MPKRANPSLSDSEIKLSEDISHSEISQRHERRHSSYLKNEGRNHMDDHRYHTMNKNKMKSGDKLNQSKDAERMNDRLSKFEILKDKDQSFSTKGPMLALNDNRNLLDYEEQMEANGDYTGRRSEILKEPTLDDVAFTDPNENDSSQLKSFMKQKISDSKKLKDNNDGQEEPSQDFNELVAFPSDDEMSKKLKSDVIKDINSIEEGSDECPDYNETVIIGKKPEDIKAPEKAKDANRIKIVDQEQPDPQKPNTTKSIQRSDDDWHSGFPSIAEKTNNQEDGRTSRRTPPNFDILDDILGNGENENDSLCDEDLLRTDSKEVRNIDTNDEDNLEDLLKSTPKKSETDNEEKNEFLAASQRSNIPTEPELEKGKTMDMDDPPVFTTQDQEKNKSFHEQESQDEDKAPSKPKSQIDVEGIDHIDHVAEPDNVSDTNFWEEPNPDTDKAMEGLLLDSEIKEPGPSISDIMNDDLTGNNQPVPQGKKKSRTLDDLPGAKGPVGKDAKADALADELLFYLVMETRNSLFPQRVNPGKLKLQTEEEIKKYESEKDAKSARDSSTISESKTAEELREEMAEELPQSKMAILTDPKTLKEYMETLFTRIQGKEEDFIGNLSSPLQRNPLEILMHLQNTMYELEPHEQLPYQQSVLTVDIYLDIERSRKRDEEERLALERDQAREKYDAQKKLKDENKTEKDEPDKPKEKPIEPNSENTEKPKAETANEGENDASSSASEFTKEEELNLKLFNLK